MLQSYKPFLCIQYDLRDFTLSSWKEYIQASMETTFFVELYTRDLKSRVLVAINEPLYL